MATTKHEQKNLPAVVEEKQESGLAIAQDALAFFDAAGGGKSNLDLIDQPFFRISTQGRVYRVGELPLGKDGKGQDFTAHILKVVNTRAFYLEKFDPSAPTPPDCASIGGVSPDPAAEKKQATFCASCPQNKWGTGTDAKGQPSRGKACKEAKRLVIFYEGIELPCLLSLPPTAQGMFQQFLKQVHTMFHGKVPVWAVKVNFAFDMSPKVSWPKPTIELVGLEQDVEKLTMLKEMVESQYVTSAANAYASAHEYEAEGDVPPAEEAEGAPRNW